jgi:hypothetical protein
MKSPRHVDTLFRVTPREFTEREQELLFCPFLLIAFDSQMPSVLTLPGLNELTAVVENEIKNLESEEKKSAQGSVKNHMPNENFQGATDESVQAEYVVKSLFHSKMSVVTFEGIHYLVGVQVARRLNRKTFNMYRCMKKKKIDIRRATQKEVDFLKGVGAVHAGTHSITLVPFKDGLCFAADVLYRNIRFPNEEPSAKRKKSFVLVKSKIHRRKPLPWDVQRAVKRQISPRLFLSNENHHQLPSAKEAASVPQVLLPSGNLNPASVIMRPFIPSQTSRLSYLPTSMGSRWPSIRPPTTPVRCNLAPSFPSITPFTSLPQFCNQ